MIVDVVMPKMGESIMEGTVIEWRANVGDTIKRDDILLEIATDKVDSEIPSPSGGTVTEILFKPQDTVEVGVVIARIDTSGEAAVASAPEKKVGPDAPKPEVTVTPKPDPIAPAPQPVAAPAPIAAQPMANGSERRFYTPLVRSIARKENVTDNELATIAGSGHAGRVNKSDIRNYLAQRQAGTIVAPAVAASSTQIPAPTAMGALIDEVVPMGRIRQRIAHHMRESLDTSTHVYGLTESDVTDMVAYRGRHKDSFLAREGIKLTYTPMIAYATLRAIRDFPLINASIDGSDIVKKKNINLGVAVALPDFNLIVSVIRNAEELNFLGLSRQIADLATRARSGDLAPDEAAGSTFTITNPGLYGNLIGLPIINQPNVGILSVGTIKKRPIVWENDGVDSIVIRSMMMMALGHDHRLIDGAYGAQFLERVVHYLQTIKWDTVQ